VFYPDLFSPLLLAFLSIAFSLLLVAEIPMFSLKFKNFSWQSNKLRYIFLLCSLVAICIFQLMALPGIIIGYIGTSLVVYAVSKKN
ncbi:MAG: hypothetical protein LBM68_03215, partial [Bacteroidales bacterium]|jgi:CDP-diacylglycerol--serine O-phosphatidyltransferase|nr:hypothetical protein [Bacteroidales bacterium]